MRAPAVLPLSLAVVALAGCGGGVRHATPPKPTRAQQVAAVVRAWSAHLDADDNRGAAHLFRLPALIIQRPYAWRFPSYADIALWHSTLPCAGHIVSVHVRGDVATVVFRLGDRLASKCDAPGQLAAARITVVRGKIVRWEQIAVPKPGPVA